MKKSFINSKNNSIRPSNIGDLLVTEREINDLFFEGDSYPFQEALKRREIQPIRSSSNKEDHFVLRETIPIIKKYTKLSKF